MSGSENAIDKGTKLHCYKGRSETSPRARCGASAVTNPGRVVPLRVFSGAWPRHLDRCRLCLKSVAQERERLRRVISGN